MGSLVAQFERCVGTVLESGRLARDPVNVPMIRNFCDAIGDTNPVYLDDDAARSAGFPGIVAPPGMLRTWTMVPPAEQLTPDDDSGASVYSLLAGAGFTSKAATNCDVSFRRYLVPGDLLNSRTSLAAVSEEKTTAIGVGHFVDTVIEYFDADDRPVADMRWRSLRFRPGSLGAARRSSRAADTPPAPAPDAPPPWEIPITTTLVVAGAMASRDYQDVHHDPSLAQRRGMPDIFTNMMTTSGLLSRFVTDWTGPTGRIRAISQVLGKPNHPGDTLTLRVLGSAVDHGSGDRTLTISGTNALGRHVLATVVLATADMEAA